MPGSSPKSGGGRRDSPRLRIALVIEDVGLGGGQERVLAELAPRLARRHDVHLFCHTVRDIDLTGITVHRIRALPAPPGVRALWFTLSSSLTIHPSDYDIVLSQGGNTLVQSWVLAHTVHRDRHRLRAQMQRRFRLKPAWRHAWECVRDAIFAALERGAALRCRGRVIAVSLSVRDYFVREYGLMPQEIRIARNGVDHDVFSPELRAEARPRIRSELALADDDFVALFMGGLWFEKGLAETVEALAAGEEPWRLVVVGEGPRERFEAMASEHSVADRVTFVPHVHRPQDYFAMADCLVHPYPIEPFGLVVLEAAACGLPLLAARSGVALDLIEDGRSGFFIERRPAEIAARLDELFRDRAMLERMRGEVHRRSLRFSWDRQAEEIEEIFLQATSAEDASREAGGRS